MRKLTKDDIANCYYEFNFDFKGLNDYPEYYDECGVNCGDVESLKNGSGKNLTAKEIMDKFDVSAEVADKLIRYQAKFLANYREQVFNFLQQKDRYLEIKPYVNDKKLDSYILSQYVNHNFKGDKLLAEFNPAKHLIRGVIGSIVSCVILAALMILSWEGGYGIFDILSAGLLVLIWLGITLSFVWNLPKEYRTKKVILKLIKSKHNP